MGIFERRPCRFGGSVSAFALFAIAAALLSTSAHAGLITTDTVNAMPEWYGTLNIHFVEEFATEPSKVVDGSVDYAVYAPGNFNSSFSGQDPSNGSRYVYRYQLHNNVGSSYDGLMKLTIALVGLTSSSQAVNCKWIEPDSGGYPAGGLAPPLGFYSVAGNPPTSVNWSYKQSSLLQPGAFSKMLIFTSPLGPTFQPATVNSLSSIQHWVDDDGTQYNWWEGQLPSPVPEPATFLGVLAFGGFSSFIGLFGDSTIIGTFYLFSNTACICR